MKNTQIKHVHKTLALGITGLGLIMASQAMAGTIIGTRHDMSGNYGGGRICVVCHTPHNAEVIVGAPLWNHATSTAQHTLYNSPTFDGSATIGQPGGVSILCLSCHDGTVAIDSFGDTTGSNYMSGDNTTGPNLTADLSNDHPISFTYDTALSVLDPGLFDPSTKQVTIGEGDKVKTESIDVVMLFDGQVQCASCHDVHNGFTQDQPLLRVTKAGSALCLVCHDK